MQPHLRALIGPVFCLPEGIIYSRHRCSAQYTDQAVSGSTGSRGSPEAKAPSLERFTRPRAVAESYSVQDILGA
eukprot:scaffold643059_cov34-Prasinocladus_malaysianus.AAC.1